MQWDKIGLYESKNRRWRAVRDYDLYKSSGKRNWVLYEIMKEGPPKRINDFRTLDSAKKYAAYLETI